MSRPEDKNGFTVSVGENIRLEVVKDPGFDQYTIKIVCVVDGLEIATSPYKNPVKAFLDLADDAMSILRCKIDNDEIGS